MDWRAINREYPWLQPLKKTPQDPAYHAEGDVSIHTRLVLESLIQLKQWHQLQKTDQALLFWAALLHDIAKPVCTRTQPNGRIQTQGHTQKGEYMARAIMYKGIPEPVPFPLRETIAKLVRFHGLPIWLMEKTAPLKTIIRISQMVCLHHLAILAEADARGRIFGQPHELLDRIQFFREYSSENGCYMHPYFFETDLARITYLNGEHASPTYKPFDTTWGEVILMSGLPGAGKDTWIRANAFHLPVVSLDNIRTKLGIGPEKNQGIVIQTAKQHARELLRKKESFIWNATNTTSKIRKPLIDMFISYGAKVKIVYIESTYRVLFKQNKNRNHAVPENVLERLLQKLDVPSRDEAHRVVYYV